MQGAGQLLYSTVQLAAVPTSYAAQWPSAALQLRLTRRHLIQHVAAGVWRQTPGLEQQPLRMAGAALQALQQHNGAGCQVIASAGMPHEITGGAQSFSEAALHALLRVAAAESSSQDFSSLQVTDLRQPDGMQQSADSYGASALSGALHQPQLQPATLLAGTAVPAAAMISGGLGGLGSLAGQFMAQAGACQLQLLGRSGRGDFSPSSFGEACVTTQRCDVASAEEVCF